MATRPIFRPYNVHPYVEVLATEFQWHAGFSKEQKQRSVAALHEALLVADKQAKPLEISSKSTVPLGVALSAFNLKVTLGTGKTVALENLFQASKVFETGGPYKDLLTLSPLEAKRDPRLKESGPLKAFQGRDQRWPLEPKTLYYDWIYLNALYRQPELWEPLLAYDAFTDIEFNPKTGFNCQARSVALFVALVKLGEIESVLASPEAYQSYFGVKDTPNQSSLLLEAAEEPSQGALFSNEAELQVTAPLADTADTPNKG